MAESLPLMAGDFVLHSVGTLDARPGYTTEAFIYPIGYAATRMHPAIEDPTRQCLYSCRILEGDEAPEVGRGGGARVDGPLGSGARSLSPSHRPQFEVVSCEDPDTAYRAPSATEAWTQVIKQIFVRPPSFSGEEYFGLCEPAVGVRVLWMVPSPGK